MKKTDKEAVGAPLVAKPKEVADTEFMLEDANRYIQKLEMQLKEKTIEAEHHVKRWQFYEQIVRNLTTFSGY